VGTLEQSERNGNLPVGEKEGKLKTEELKMRKKKERIEKGEIGDGCSGRGSELSPEGDGTDKQGGKVEGIIVGRLQGNWGTEKKYGKNPGELNSAFSTRV